jgi:hypothetical protein
MKSEKSNTKVELLIGAGLDVLHFESVEWLETIAFWKDEARFFDMLLNKKEASESKNPAYQKMLINLDKIHNDLFEDLEDRIIEHEKLLSNIVQGQKGLSDNDYREKHRKIMLRLEGFTGDFKIFKRLVFEYMKGI